MYENNHLAHVLCRGTAMDSLFAETPTGTTLTYGALFARAEAWASGLIAAGVQPGDRVTAQVDKSLDVIALYLATVLAGGVFQPLNTAYTGNELAYFISDATPRVVVCQPKAEVDTRAIIDQVGTQSQVYTLGADCTGTLMGLGRAVPTFKAVARGPDDLAAILYTSGTTGRSKGAMLTHKNLASNANTLAEHWGFTPDDVLIHALPIFHTHGLFVATNVALVAGAKLLFHDRFDAEAIVQEMPRASVLMGVPTFYTRLLEHPGLDAAARGMRLFISGSAPLLAETHTAWQARTGHAVLERYGMSETNMNTSNPLRAERRAGSVGPALSGVEVRVVDPATGTLLPAGTVGSIEVSGPNVFRGYWNMPEKTKQEFRADGFFITGDLGTLSSDGYLTIVGRSKDLVITGGYNVYPKEVETILDAVDGVSESAVFGVAHPDFGEAVVATIVLEHGRRLEESALERACAHNLARYKHPKRFIVLDSLPRNAMGKVEKAKLRTKHGSLFAAA